MVRKRIIGFNEAFNAFVVCTCLAILLPVYYSAITGLRLTAWQCWIVFNTCRCNVLFEKSAVVIFKKENNKIVSNFSRDIFTTDFSEIDFNEMFKVILAEMNTDYPALLIPSKTNAEINKLLSDRGIANVKLI